MPPGTGYSPLLHLLLQFIAIHQGLPFIDLDVHSGHLYGFFPLDDACFEPHVAVSILVESLEIIAYSVFIMFPE